MPRSATSTTVARNVGSSSSSSAAMTRQAQSTNRPAAISTTTTGTRSSTTNTPTTTTAARTQPTTPAPATGTTMNVPSQGVRRTRTRYPEALPSEIDEVFSGPVQGTAVIGTSYTLAASTTMDLLLPKQHLAMMDQAKDNPLGTYCSTGKTSTTSTGKTAAMTPERRSDRGSERVFGSNSISPDDLSTSHEAFAHPQQQQQQQHALLHPMSESNNDNNKDGTTSGPACPYGLPCVHIADSLPNVLDGGFVVFTDSFVEAHPQSRIAAVTQAYRKASEYANDEGEEAEKPDAEAQKSQLQKVRTYIKEVQEQSRPLFRRRPSEIVYGTAAYLPRTAEDEEHTTRQHDDASGDEAQCHTSFAT